MVCNQTGLTMLSDKAEECLGPLQGKRDKKRERKRAQRQMRRKNEALHRKQLDADPYLHLLAEEVDEEEEARRCREEADRLWKEREERAQKLFAEKQYQDRERRLLEVRTFSI